MPQFCVDMQRDGSRSHLVHAAGCAGWPVAYQVRMLGSHVYWDDVLRSAQKYYLHVDACPRCLPRALFPPDRP